MKYCISNLKDLKEGTAVKNVVLAVRDTIVHFDDHGNVLLMVILTDKVYDIELVGWPYENDWYPSAGMLLSIDGHVVTLDGKKKLVCSAAKVVDARYYEKDEDDEDADLPAYLENVNLAQEYLNDYMLCMENNCSDAAKSNLVNIICVCAKLIEDINK